MGHNQQSKSVSKRVLRMNRGMGSSEYPTEDGVESLWEGRVRVDGS